MTTARDRRKKGRGTWQKLPDETFLTTVKSLLATAQAQRELLVSKGMQETLLEDHRARRP